MQHREPHARGDGPTEWETVLDQTHTYTAPKDCADDNGEGEGGPGEDTQKSAAGGIMPVTGGALVGLVAAALVAVGAGGSALYLARKRKAVAAE